VARYALNRLLLISLTIARTLSSVGVSVLPM